MQTLSAQIGSTARSVGEAAGNALDLAPDVRLPGFTMRFDRNEEIFAEEEAADFVYKVLSGAVREVRILCDGRRQIGAFYLPGDVFGLEPDALHRNTAEAVADCEIALVRRAAVERLADADAAAARRLWSLTARNLTQLQDHVLLLSCKSAVERVAGFLIRLSARVRSAGAVDLPMSRLDIADHLGLTIETVSRSFTQLERDGAISLPCARHIVLHDRLALIDA